MPTAPLPSTSNLSPNQIGDLIYANHQWGPGKKATKEETISFLDTAIAICLAESGGDPKAVNGVHYGLYQIGKDSHPDLFLSHKWDDPADNVDMARLVWQRAGNSWTPWTKFDNWTAYKGHGQAVYMHLLATSVGGVKNIDTRPSKINAVNDITGRVQGIVAGALKDLMTFVSTAFLTIGAALLAGLLVILGVWFFVKDTETGKAVKSAAKDAALTAAVA